jgi:translation initiation factor IF-2
MPQTLEAISHAKAAKVKIVVAINKTDLPSANPDRVKQQLQEKGLAPEDWGGDTICIPVSATKGTGIDQLLESVLLEAEMLELKASPAQSARCNVIEAQVEQGRGPTTTVIVRSGTLRYGDVFICGNHWGKVKQLIDDLGKPVKEAGPSTPVKVLGLSGLPNAGDELVVMDSEKSARIHSEERLAELRDSKLAAPQRATLENLFASIASEAKPTLKAIVKCDVQGSLEAVVASLGEIPQKKITLDIIHSAVGPITESDVLLASASNAIIIGFNTKTENTGAQAAKREGVQIKLYSIIYELLDQVREAMGGMLAPELREAIIGHAEVKQVFDLTKGKVAGCIVTDGRIARTARARVLRRKQPIYDGGIATLRRFTDEVKEVRSGLECGIKLGDFSEYMVEDIIECYTLEKIPQQL